MTKNTSVFLYRLLAALKGPIIMYLIVRYLSGVEQGEWFLFTSLGAITTLVDLGFGTMISNFIANANGSKSDKELFFLINYTKKIYYVLMMIGFVLMSMIGYFIISFHLFILYFAYTASNILLLYSSSKIVVLMGMDRVKDAHIAMSIGLTGSIFTLLILVPQGFSLLSLALSVFIQSVLIIVCLKNLFSFKQYKYSIDSTDEFKENKRHLWYIYGKYALSWIAGFLIFNSYVPILSKKVGIIEAGKIGLLIAMISACMNLALTWSHSISPRLAHLIGDDEYLDALKLWRESRLKGFLFFVFSISLILVLYFIEVPFLPLSEKLPELDLAICLVIIFFVRMYGSLSATLIRSQKKEEHTGINVVTGMFTIAILLFTTDGNTINSFQMLAGYSLVVLLPVYYFLVKRNVYQNRKMV